MENIKLSVIIPAYNAGESIGRCLDSIFDSVQDGYIEIICVDDGSKDDTWQVLQRYAAKYACIHAFHKKNGGVGSARNVGLSKVTGDYIAWVDSDDYVTADWYSEIMTGLTKYQPDCLFFDYFYTYGEKNEPQHIALPEKVELGSFVYEQSLERELKNFLWNQVIRANFLKKAVFNETYHMLEDYDILTQITPDFKSIIHLKKCLYHYVQTDSSLTHNVSTDVLWNNISVVKRRYDKYTALGLPVSINDYMIQLVEYLYNHGGEDKAEDTERLISIRHQLRLVSKNVFCDKGISKRLRIKAIFAVLNLDSILSRILFLKRMRK
ncbi:glycosyltransferase family 2 protein [uncultured Megasphaera sp.]|uniref:glycosyltransferase family 2 protein n=1 Tax=uncultured Megasphaera sp. TaxID=165188 RepID=UPI0025E383B5|nr:glycosyltransferase family 2 protein [uncultured Megasphaera sp.]